MEANVELKAAPERIEPESKGREHFGSEALDQWRGLALVLVLISHGFFFTNRVNGIGRVGVNLFFFISGILVFRSISRSKAANQWSRSRLFWWRRLRRLYPAVIAYGLAMLAGTWWLQHRPNLPPMSDFASYVRAMPAAFGYFANYIETPMSLGHLWSLSCEMQFYLLAPLIYILGGRAERRRNLVFGLLLMFLIGLGLAQPMIGKWKYHFEFAVWPMMFGFFCEYKRGWFLWLPGRCVTIILWAAIAICGASMLLMLFGMKMKVTVIAVGTLLLLPCMLAYLFGRPMPGLFGCGMKWLGERTYSIYLWQQPFTICNFLPSGWHPVGAMISIAVGAAWFRIFEFPFLSASRKKQAKPL